MIKELEIVGFKRFANVEIELAPLTVLSGMNGAGKTTVIQAFLLAHEAASGVPSVPLNGPFGLDLGSAQDVLNLDAATDTAEIALTMRLEDRTSACFRLDARDQTLLHLPVKGRPDSAQTVFGKSERAFTYLCAERLGPRNVLGASARPSDDLGVGVRGEYCAQVMEVHGLKEKVEESRRHPDRRGEVDSFLKYQVEAWLSDIVRAIEIDTIWYPGTAVTALRFRSPGGEWVRAPNMGFGVSYSLPIVLAGLFAPAGSLLLVENPEAHLHPAGQSQMGTFLAVIAGAGVQVIVETHSDHVLNGVRRAIGEKKVLGAGPSAGSLLRCRGGRATEHCSAALHEGGELERLASPIL